MDDRFFSRRWARDYFKICSKLSDIDIIGNDIEYDDSIGVDEGAIRELIERGYNKTELPSPVKTGWVVTFLICSC